MDLVAGYKDDKGVYREATFTGMHINDVLDEMLNREHTSGIHLLHIRPSERDMKRLDRLEAMVTNMGLAPLLSLLREQRRQLFHET